MSRSSPRRAAASYEHVAGHAEQQHGVGQRGQDLQPVQAERALRVVAGVRCGVDGGQRHAQAEGVGGHVAGVGQQGERAGDEAGDDLDDQEGQDQQERDEQRPLVAGPGPRRRRSVRVVMVVAHVPGVVAMRLVAKPRPGPVHRPRGAGRSGCQTRSGRPVPGWRRGASATGGPRARHRRVQPRRHADADLDRLVAFYRAAFGAEPIFEMEAHDDHPRMIILDLGGGAAINVFEVPAEEIIGEQRRQGGRGAIDHFASRSTRWRRWSRSGIDCIGGRRRHRRDPAAGLGVVAVLPRLDGMELEVCCHAD